MWSRPSPDQRERACACRTSAASGLALLKLITHCEEHFHRMPGDPLRPNNTALADHLLEASRVGDWPFSLNYFRPPHLP